MRHVGRGHASGRSTQFLAAAIATVACSVLDASLVARADSIVAAPPADQASQATQEDVQRLDERLSIAWLDNFVTSRDLEFILEWLSATAEERQAAHKLHDMYLDQVVPIAETTWETTADLGKKLSDNRKARPDVPDVDELDMADEIAATTAEVANCLRDARLRCDRHLEDFLAGLQQNISTLTPERFEELTRKIWLFNEKRSRARSSGARSFSEHALYDYVEASLEEGELAVLSDAALLNARSEAERERYVSFRAELDEILSDYERVHAELLFELSRSRRLPWLDDPAARQARSERRRASQWSRRYDAMERAVARIGDLLARLHDDPSRRELWRHGFRRALAPEMFPKWTADSLLDWLDGRDDTTDLQLQLARDLHIQYGREREEKEIAAFNMAVAAVRNHGHLWADLERQKVYYRQLHAMNRLQRRLFDDIRAVLNERQRVDFDAFLAHTERYVRKMDIFIPRSIEREFD